MKFVKVECTCSKNSNVLIIDCKLATEIGKKKGKGRKKNIGEENGTKCTRKRNKGQGRVKGGSGKERKKFRNEEMKE